ncbi:MAG: ribonuclease PH [Candidatus Omnitrophica bacterium CG11_big_fil_rev_8_21_14_0_20_63_9]|nr:MAG: ribonuclease PH [Candidatus Omnitrophica bacterium CG11_big_fil_rev_8_21_14_0_20_63_9]
MSATRRVDGRLPNQLRPVKLSMGVMQFAEASCLVEWGHTKLICTATVEEKVPPFLRNSGTGWVTGEYGMLPRSSQQRIEREANKGRLGGRTQEIQRLIGRSLRTVVDLAKLGERSIIIDCDVIQADGGTRCASITGGFVALVEALRGLRKQGVLTALPIRDFVAAVSVGMVQGQPVLDVNYKEDSSAGVDMNIVMTGRGGFVELQGTAEREPFTTSELTHLLRLARGGIRQLVVLQRKALGASSLRRL